MISINYLMFIWFFIYLRKSVDAHYVHTGIMKCFFKVKLPIIFMILWYMFFYSYVNWYTDIDSMSHSSSFNLNVFNYILFSLLHLYFDTCSLYTFVDNGALKTIHLHVYCNYIVWYKKCRLYICFFTCYTKFFLKKIMIH